MCARAGARARFYHIMEIRYGNNPGACSKNNRTRADRRGSSVETEHTPYSRRAAAYHPLDLRSDLVRGRRSAAARGSPRAEGVGVESDLTLSLRREMYEPVNLHLEERCWRGDGAQTGPMRKVVESSPVGGHHVKSVLRRLPRDPSPHRSPLR